jgi:hypothetical protein
VYFEINSDVLYFMMKTIPITHFIRLEMHEGCNWRLYAFHALIEEKSYTPKKAKDQIHACTTPRGSLPIQALFVCVVLVGRNKSEPDCFSNLYKL